MDANYKEILIQTVQETYPKYAHTRIIKQLEKDGLVLFTDELIKSQGAVDLSDVEEHEQLAVCIRTSDKIAKKIELMEFTNSYTYSVIFDIDEFPAHEILNHLSARGLVRDVQEGDASNDSLFGNFMDGLTPTKFILDDNIVIFKFSRLLIGYVATEGNNLRKIKYPVLALLYKDINVLEIRFGKVRGFLKNNDEYFYIKQIESIKEWIENNLACEVEAVNISPIVENISRFNKEEVYVSAQAMNLKSKKKAILDTGDNDEDVLPLLGELKELMKANEKLFNQSPKVKELLENFILETEENSDLPWLSLTWKNESKTNATRIKFHFNYMNKDYGLLQYYYNSKAGMERMNYVTRYLIENRGALESEFED